MNTTALYRGKRNYELSNHLGNFNGCWFCESRPYRHESRERSASGVNVVISDKRKSVCDEELGVEYFVAEVLSAVDYYPFGAPLVDRQWYANSDSSAYSFGFGGQLKDDEVSGVGNSYSAEFWQYDSRLGRRFNVDPLVRKTANLSPYQVFLNCPLIIVDPKGLEGEVSDAELAESENITPTTPLPGAVEFTPTEPSSSGSIGNNYGQNEPVTQFDLSQSNYREELNNLFLYWRTEITGAEYEKYSSDIIRIANLVNLTSLGKSSYFERNVTAFGTSFMSKTEPLILIDYSLNRETPELVHDVYLMRSVNSNLKIELTTSRFGVVEATYTSADGEPLRGFIYIVIPTKQITGDCQDCWNTRNAGIQIRYNIGDEVQFQQFVLQSTGMGLYRIVGYK